MPDPLTTLFDATLPPIIASSAARAVACRFPGFGEAIAAPFDAVKEAAGSEAAAVLSAVRSAASALLLDRVRGEPILTNWPRLLEYLHAVMARERCEQVRVVFLDSRNRLIADDVLWTGSPTHAPAYPREIARRAVLLDATAAILAHNHPSGDPTPSREDIAMTREVNAALTALGIALHDHVVVGASATFSFRQEGLL